jgi:E3 ubiquitin-protein ligase TRIP12
MRARSERRGFEKILYEQHLDRLRSAKGYVDCGPPRAHPLSNKAEMDKRRKFAAIEFDNKLLLERLAAVVQTKTIDNEMDKATQHHKVFKAKLSLTKKKLELQKITEENQRILKRIQEVPPAYNHLEWEEEAKIHEKHKRGMALYPEYYDRLDREAQRKNATRKNKTQSASVRPSTAGGFDLGGGGGATGTGMKRAASNPPMTKSPGGFY